MQAHYQLSDAAFAQKFHDCTLTPQWFTHEAHLRLAWVYIRQFGLEKAEKALCTDIARFDRTFDDGTKFHTTLTVAAAKVVHHFMQKGTYPNFQALIEAHPRLIYNFKDLLLSHYEAGVLFSNEAKYTYVKPDLLPF